ncbi:hypothetical protein ACP70R_015286 [Stipagrostis hirtigluma subsp. patula]
MMKRIQIYTPWLRLGSPIHWHHWCTPSANYKFKEQVTKKLELQFYDKGILIMEASRSLGRISRGR